MDTLSQFPTWVIPVVLIIIGVLVLLVKGYVNAKPNEVIVITGLRKQRHLRGKAGFMIPFILLSAALIWTLNSSQQMFVHLNLFLRETLLTCVQTLL